MQTSHQKPTLILLHEIYGINDHMKSIIRHFERAGFVVYCPHLLGQVKHFDADSEDEAYRYFMDEVGFEQSVKAVLHLARDLKTKDVDNDIFVLGFSVGATIAWLCSSYEQLFTGIIGFYGSRIRDYVAITPTCNTLLIFPTIETSFNPQQIVAVLEKKDGLCVTMVEGRHGFANPHSEAFDADSKDRCFQEVEDFVNANLKKDRSVRIT